MISVLKWRFYLQLLTSEVQISQMWKKDQYRERVSRFFKFLLRSISLTISIRFFVENEKKSAIYLSTFRFHTLLSPSHKHVDFMLF